MNPAETLDRYASNKLRNAVSTGYFVVVLVAVTALWWKLAGWAGVDIIVVVGNFFSPHSSFTTSHSCIRSIV